MQRRLPQITFPMITSQVCGGETETFKSWSGFKKANQRRRRLEVTITITGPGTKTKRNIEPPPTPLLPPLADYGHSVVVVVVIIYDRVINAFLSAICKTSAAPTHAT